MQIVFHRILNGSSYSSRVAIAVLVSLTILTILPAQASDNHVGYYYPEPSTREVYATPRQVLPNANRNLRIGLTVGLNAQHQKRGYAPPFHIFAKGFNAEKLIIVAVDSGRYNTLFRLRSYLAALTADARATKLFADLDSPDRANFLDLCSMAGFEEIILTDGDKLSHRIVLQ